MEWEIKSRNLSYLSRRDTNSTRPPPTTTTHPFAQSGKVTYCCSRTLAEIWCWFRRSPSPADWPWCVWLFYEEWALFSCSFLCVCVWIFPPACRSQAVSRQVVYAPLAAWKWCDKTMLLLARIHTAPALTFLLSLPLSLALRGRLILNALAGSDTAWRLGMQGGEILLASMANYNLCSHLGEVRFLSELSGPGHVAFRLFRAVSGYPNPKG